MHGRVAQVQEERETPALWDVVGFRVQLRQRVAVFGLRRRDSLEVQVRKLGVEGGMREIATVPVARNWACRGSIHIRTRMRSSSVNEEELFQASSRSLSSRAANQQKPVKESEEGLKKTHLVREHLIDRLLLEDAIATARVHAVVQQHRDDLRVLSRAGEAARAAGVEGVVELGLCLCGERASVEVAVLVQCQ